MAPANHPRSAPAWLELLEQQPLRVQPIVLTAIVHALKDADVSLHALGILIEQDSVLRLNLARTITDAFKADPDRTPTDTFHTLSMLGLDRTRAFLQRQQACSDEPQSAALRGTIEASMMAIEAVAVTQAWHELRHQSHGSDIALALHIRGAVRSGLWQQVPGLMTGLQTLTQAYHIPIVEAEQALLGCSLAELTLLCAQTWRLPPRILAALTPSELPPLRWSLRNALNTEQHGSHLLPNRTPAGQLVNSSAVVQALADQLIQDAQTGWYQRRVHRWLRLVSIFADTPISTTQAITRERLLAVAAQGHDHGGEPTATRFVWADSTPARRRLTPAQVIAWAQQPHPLPSATPAVTPDATAAAASAATMVPSTAAPPANSAPAQSAPVAPAPAAGSNQTLTADAFQSPAHQKRFIQFLQTTLLNTHYSDTVESLLLALMNQLHSCSRLERLMFARFEMQQQRLICQQTSGCHPPDLLNHLVVSLQPRNVITQLSQKPAAVFLGNPSDTTQHVIPGSLKQANAEQPALLVSLFDTHGPWGVLYADCAQTCRPLEQADFTLFKLCAKGLQRQLLRLAPKPTGTRQQ